MADAGGEWDDPTEDARDLKGNVEKFKDELPIEEQLESEEIKKWVADMQQTYPDLNISWGGGDAQGQNILDAVESEQSGQDGGKRRKTKKRIKKRTKKRTQINRRTKKRTKKRTQINRRTKKRTQINRRTKKRTKRN